MKLILILFIFISPLLAFSKSEKNVLIIDNIDTDKKYIAAISMMSATDEGIWISTKTKISCFIPFTKDNLHRLEKNCEGGYSPVDTDIVRQELIETFMNAKLPIIECTYMEKNKIVAYSIKAHTTINGVDAYVMKGQLLTRDADMHYARRHEDAKNPLEPAIFLLEKTLKAVLF